MEEKFVSAKFEKLNGLLGGGFYNGELIMLFSRPGIGKSSFILNCIKKDDRVLLFNFGYYLDYVIDVKCGELKGYNITVCRDWLSPQEIFNKCKDVKEKYGLDYVIVDYLQIMKGDDVGETLEAERREIVSSLKNTAKELDVPIILLSQIAREAKIKKDREDRRYTVEDFGGTGRAADTVMVIDREAVHMRPVAKDGEVYLLKNPHGECGVLDFACEWDGRIMRFSGL